MYDEKHYYSNKSQFFFLSVKIGISPRTYFFNVN